MLSSSNLIWAKTVSPGLGGPRSHPLLYHSLDVAAVAEALLGLTKAQWRDLAARLGVETDTLLRVLILCCALHDIGKCSVYFQSKVREFWPGDADPIFGIYPGRISGPTHGEITALYLRRVRHGPHAPVSAALDAAAGGDLAALIPAIAGHHGRPTGDIAQPTGPMAAANRPFRDTACAIAAQLAATLGADNLPPLRSNSDDDIAELSWRLSTLLPVCDWIASNQDWFPARYADDDAPDYWRRHAAPQAARAIAATGLAPARLAPAAPERTLRHLGGRTLTPVQRWAFECPLAGAEPSLTLIEDATGSGKTEAALALTHRLMAQSPTPGFYFALPTMATANAMYARLAEAYRALFADGEQPSLVLAHGNARHNQAFLGSLADLEARRNGDEGDVGAYCSGWIADSRRKALLAQAGAGTIDQALMAILPLRYQSLRLHGLAGKVLILDEVHSFDPFTLALIETLLSFHAMLGGSAVLLSATLPAGTRARLVKAFAKGRGLHAPAVSSTAYPLATRFSGEPITQEALPMAPGSERSVKVERVATPAEGEALALRLAEQGAAVAVIRSTVDAAIASFARLKAAHERTELFHARFLLDDRLAIEERVIQTFGKTSDADARRGRILVATQVVEQSLDIDFDAMISDLAPIDLLIQRAGRLWRHARADRPLAAPVLHVISPAPTDACDRNWLDADLKEAKWVYEDTARLWLSARRLFDAGAIVTRTLADGEDDPCHVRCLVEAVYGADRTALPTPDLAQALDKFEGVEMARGNSGKHGALNLHAGYALAGGAWESDARAVTRLELKPRLPVRLAKETGAELRPLRTDWSLSELRLTERMAKGLAAPSPRERQRLVPAWAEADEGTLLLVLRPVAEGQTSADGRFAYDALHGLRRLDEAARSDAEGERD